MKILNPSLSISYLLILCLIILATSSCQPTKAKVSLFNSTAETVHLTTTSGRLVVSVAPRSSGSGWFQGLVPDYFLITSGNKRWLYKRTFMRRSNRPRMFLEDSGAIYSGDAKGKDKVQPGFCPLVPDGGGSSALLRP
jgi:hypothetical protein